MIITARTIEPLLQRKHTDDVYYTEVSIDGGRRRMDAWAMKKSWANPLVTAYEIKVSRSDFLNDHKMQDYMDYCNEIYVVAPKGVLGLNEIPEEFGYLEVSANGKKLFTKKKAKYRPCTLSEDFLRSILFSKADDFYSRLDTPTRALARRLGTYKGFEKIAEDEAELQYVGAAVSRKFHDITRENLRLKQELDTLQEVKLWKQDFAKVFGFDSASQLQYNDRFDSQLQKNIERMLNELQNPQLKIIDDVLQLESELQKFKQKLGAKE